MKRYLVLFSIALIIGILSADLTQSLKFIIITLSILCILISVLIYKDRALLFPLTGIFVFFAIGAFEYLYMDNVITRKFINFNEQQVIVQGVICSKPEYKDANTEYKDGRIRCEMVTYQVSFLNKENAGASLNKGNADTSQTKNKERISKGKILLTIYGQDLLLEYGSEIEVTGVLTIPNKRRNPGSLDYRRYLAGSGISATIYTKSSNVKTGNTRDEGILLRTGHIVRERIIKVINLSLPERQAPLLNAMLTGYRGEVPDELQENFSDSGLIHIMAVSGLHVGFIMLPFVFVFNKLGLKKKIANPIVILVLLIYVLITGPQSSVLRAVIMAVTVLIGQMIWREPDTLTSISFASILILLWRPHMLFNVGFQLSFAATVSIVLFNKNIKEFLKSKYISDNVSSILATTLSAQAGILPITAVYFNKVSLISAFSNLLVAPITGIIIMLGMAMAGLGQIYILFSRIIGYINTVLLTFVIFVSKTAGNLPFAMLKVVTPSILLITVYYILIWFLFWFKPKYKVKIKPEYYIIALMFIIAFTLIANLLPGEMEVVFLDVGEGDSAFIRTPSGKAVLIDGGGKKGDNFEDGTNVGNKVVIPFLLEFGVTKLDMVVVTHAHEDHINGIMPVLEEIKVENVIIPDYIIDDEFDKLLDICSQRKIKVTYVSKDNSINLGKDTYIKILNPPKDTKKGELSLNNSSVVLKLYYKDMEILFSGDIEKEVENRIIESMPDDIKADVLKVPHHGSLTSSTQEFLELVGPKAAVISVGKNNYGHPSSDVLDRLAGVGAKIFRTDLNGAVILRSNGKIIRIKVMCKDES